MFISLEFDLDLFTALDFSLGGLKKLLMDSKQK
jgi:hypothetical protein